MTLTNSSAWVIYSPIEERIKAKIDKNGIPLSQWNISINFGIKTGYNDAFFVSAETKDELISKDPKSAEIIRPILRGKDIKRFEYTFANLYVIVAKFGSYKTLEEDYPAIYSHLKTFEEGLKKRGQVRYTSSGKIKEGGDYPGQHHWLELDNNPGDKYLNDFPKPKIVWKRIGSKLRFSYDDKGVFCLDSTCFATGDSIPYLVAVLNSTMGNYLLKDSPKTGTGDLIISVQALEPVKVPRLPNELEKKYEVLLTSILNALNKGEAVDKLELTLDQMVYEAYGLSEEEQNYVQSVVSKAFR